MRPEEQKQAMKFILENDRTDWLVTTAMIFETNEGLGIVSPLNVFLKQLGYVITGTIDNPVISVDDSQ